LENVEIKMRFIFCSFHLEADHRKQFFCEQNKNKCNFSGPYNLIVFVNYVFVCESIAYKDNESNIKIKRVWTFYNYNTKQSDETHINLQVYLFQKSLSNGIHSHCSLKKMCNPFTLYTLRKYPSWWRPCLRQLVNTSRFLLFTNYLCSKQIRNIWIPLRWWIYKWE